MVTIGSSAIHCVILTCFDAEFEVYATLLRSSTIRMHCAGTLEQADFLLTVTGAGVLLSDTTFLDGSWEEAAGMLANLHPGVRLVATVDAVDGISPAHARSRGAYDLVVKPLRVGSLRRAILDAHAAAERAALAAAAYAVTPPD